MNQESHLIIMGVSGCGKSTVARLLSERLGRVFAEADDFHSPANVAKMQAGQPLTDTDRLPWLTTIRTWLDTQSDQNKSTVITCSALKYSYRDVLRQCKAPVIFAHLAGSRDMIYSRMSKRRGHFMPVSLLDSQLADLEPLRSDEDGFEVDVSGSPARIAELVRENLVRLEQKGSYSSWPAAEPWT